MTVTVNAIVIETVKEKKKEKLKTEEKRDVAGSTPATSCFYRFYRFYRSVLQHAVRSKCAIKSRSKHIICVSL